ncbi:MAG TPA: arginyltransferase [Gemmataceae bacterium]|jgi:arginine-tRNA-protein transferase|nr:arginyltransferase [Gemmataceae bacterium]
MISLYQITTPPSVCGYLPDEVWSLQHVFIAEATAAEYEGYLKRGWRRFGRAFFHPVCKSCHKCQSIRVPVATFRPDRSQRRARTANADVELRIGEPEVTAAKLDLYDRFHEFQADEKGWPVHGPKSPRDYADSFVDNPFPVEEWCYYINERLVGVGYVDVLPRSLSAIYFFYDPDERSRSLGTYNVLRIIESAADRGIPHVYLGYFVAGSRSLEYKARFQPNEVLAPDGQWKAHGRTSVGF